MCFSVFNLKFLDFLPHFLSLPFNHIFYPFLCFHTTWTQRASKSCGRSAALIYSVEIAVGIPEGRVRLRFTFSFQSLFLHEQTPASFWLTSTTLILLKTQVFSLFFMKQLFISWSVTFLQLVFLPWFPCSNPVQHLSFKPIYHSTWIFTGLHCCLHHLRVLPMFPHYRFLLFASCWLFIIFCLCVLPPVHLTIKYPVMVPPFLLSQSHFFCI